MELDDLKTRWHELDKHLEKTGVQTDRLAAEVISGKFTSAKQRLVRITRLGIFILMTLPLSLMNILHTHGTSLGATALILSAFFILTMLIRQIVLLVLLGQIKPEKQSVRETCAAVLKFRRWFLIGVVIGIGAGVPLLVILGIEVNQMTTPYVLYGFITGLLIGLPLAIRIFRRIQGEIDVLRRTLQDTEN